MPYSLQKRKKLHRGVLAVLIILLLLAGREPVWAIRLALLPLADISVDYNGIDLETTAKVAQMLREQGFDLVDEAEVRRFMATNRLYYAGTLDAFSARKMARDLGCQLILLGTVLEAAENRHQARFGLLLTALSGSSGKVVWSLEKTSALSEETGLLGIGEPRSRSDLENLVLAEVGKKLNSDLVDTDFTGGLDESHKPFQVVDFRINPNYVRSGVMVESLLRLSCLETYPDKVVVEDGNGKKHLLNPGRLAGEYRGSWPTPLNDGNYSVSLVLEWSSNDTCFTENDLTTYQTCSTPPDLQVEFRQGVVRDDVTIFNDHILILPHSSNEKPLARWQVEVTRPNGRRILQETYDGDLPGRLVWRGCDQKRAPLADGLYNFFFKVWDAAENHTVVKKKISIQRVCRPLAVKTAKRQGKNVLVVTGTNSTNSDLSPSWKLNLYSNEGVELLQSSGTTLPVEIELPRDYQESFVLCELEAQDQIGNRFTIAEKRVYMPGHGILVTQHKGEDHWSEDF